jgi:4-hydroxybenzoate polyprenyltransferase
MRLKKHSLEWPALKNRAPVRARRPSISQTVRAAEWWEYKLVPVFATAYATALLLKLPVVSMWPQLLLALAALVPCAAYVSVINDLTDLKEDLASGKPNRLVGRSRAFVAAVLACCILPGAAVAIYWRRDPLLLSLYLGAWAAFTLYSLPPVRLKGRGVFGLLADASGAHLFPTLLAVCLVYRWRGSPVEPAWVATVAVWSLSFGLRGILWHQLTDIDNDGKVGLRTFARRHKIARLRGVGNFVVFPAELCAFALMLWRLDSRAAPALLCVYALLELARARLWGVNLVVVVPKPKFQIVMLGYYEAFFPLAVLLSSAVTYPADALMVAAHFALFPRRGAQTLKDGARFISGGWRRLLTVTRARRGSAAAPPDRSP